MFFASRIISNFLSINEQLPRESISELINTSPGAFISITDSLINLFLAMLISLLLKWTYERFETVAKYNTSLSNNFLKLTLVTTFIISVVKSSLALSLGLVGALSIVRFRTSIKEPTELVYLFFCIAIGLGFGANLPVYTLIASSIIILTIIFRNFFSKRHKTNIANTFTEIEMFDKSSTLKEMMSQIKVYSLNATLIRHDYEDSKNIVFLKVNFKDIYSLDNFKNSDWFKSNVKSFSFYEDKGLI